LVCLAACSAPTTRAYPNPSGDAVLVLEADNRGGAAGSTITTVRLVSAADSRTKADIGWYEHQAPAEPVWIDDRTVRVCGLGDPSRFEERVVMRLGGSEQAFAVSSDCATAGLAH